MNSRDVTLGISIAMGLALTSVQPASAQLLDRLKKAAGVAEKVAPAVVPISTSQEITIGRGIAATVAGHYGIVRDPEITEYVNLVGTTVAAVEPRQGIRYRFAVLDTEDVNAFAAPGGYIFVTRGALDLMTDEAMLAGVLAHEVGHVNARHVIEEIRDKVRVDIGISEASDRVDVWGEALLEEAVEAGTESLFMGLSRDDELEADADGVRIAGRAGYDPTGLERFIEALDAHADRQRLSLHDKTHPDADERIDTIEDAIDDMPSDDRSGVTADARYASHHPVP